MNHHHPLVHQSHNFVLDRKILFVDSNDRDIQRWPNSCEFEINCPQIYNNVESIHILNIVLPSFYFNISERLQTNKMMIDFSGIIQPITFDDGYYNVGQIQIALQKKLTVIDPAFVVKYNEVNRKFYLGHPTKIFKFLFGENVDYNRCDQMDSYKIDVYAQHSNWGLGFLLGFDKKTYTSTRDYTIKSFDHENTDWIANTSYVISSTTAHSLENNQFLYVELEKYNKCDEIKPFLYYNYNNLNSGIVNSAFAKIPVMPSSNNMTLVDDGYLENVSYYQPPIDKLTKLKFKFRYHNGMLVDFQNYNVSFTLEINQIRNEMNSYDVRTPTKL